ncbi:MAG: hypothetical protein NVS9B7_23870 [Flavisolibacter sp.]
MDYSYEKQFDLTIKDGRCTLINKVKYETKACEVQVAGFLDKHFWGIFLFR